MAMRNLRAGCIGLALLGFVACDEKADAKSETSPDAKPACASIRIRTNAFAKKMAERPTRAARESSDEAYIADLLAQAEISGKVADELTTPTKDEELKKVVADLSAHHRSVQAHLKALAEAVKKGDKALEEKLVKKDISTSEQKALDAFEAYCTKHGHPAKN